MEEKRKSLRQTDCFAVKFLYDDGRTARIFDGLAVNCSSTGLSLYCCEELHLGEVISFTQFELLPFNTGIVRWSKHIEAGLYQIGVEGKEESTFH